MTCVFCEIINGSSPADIVLSDARFIAFLDHRPLFPGHVLLMPRRHVATLSELDDEQAGPLMRRAKRLSLAVERAVEAQGTFVALNNRVSQSVAHLHVHVVPRRQGDGLKGFFWPRHPYESVQQRQRVANDIRQALTAGEARAAREAPER